AACAEVRRCAKAHGFKAVCLRAGMASPEHRWWLPEYDPFWATCQELDLAVGLHPSTGDTMYGAYRYFDLTGTRPEQIFLRAPLGNVIDAMNALAGLIAGGVPERFPGLRFGILESSGGWLVSL